MGESLLPGLALGVLELYWVRTVTPRLLGAKIGSAAGPDLATQHGSPPTGSRPITANGTVITSLWPASMPTDQRFPITPGSRNELRISTASLPVEPTISLQGSPLRQIPRR